MTPLLIDAGNTRIKWGVPLAHGLGRWLVEGAVERGQVMQLAQAWQPLTGEVGRVCISNVAGAALQAELAQVLHAVFGAALEIEWFASLPQRAGVRNGYRTPGQLGCDRFAAAIGARALFPAQELVVATCGTATTVDAVSADGVFLGGMILPGLAMMTTSLAANTAQLPQIGGISTSVGPFADNTGDAIIAGCIAAQAGAIEHALRQRRQAGVAPLRCVLAGGAGQLLVPHLALGDAMLEKVDNLVLIGLQAALAADQDL
ncbi:type III pantothenate kinase [Herbaspirillum sp. alder98]|uniref:type III pantothenate kinase n=1 Tax=Herbaspirillum sp. alder98 TaxID=2913096 RepID=UPI001CD90AEB|nr:type III pantothenate kinase [Herbaspirillum sp. alder98]MCA1326143.1 type III pantothenate kinase [Herbaspirillum sp. alder98]